MFHCPYLLHKFIINYLFDYYSVCLQVTDCSISVSQSFTRGCSPPAPPDCYTYMIMIIKMIEMYNIAAQPYNCWWTLHTASKQSHHMAHLHIFIWKEDASLPAHHAAVWINNCLKRTFVIKVVTTDNFRNKWKPSRAIDTFRGEQRWNGRQRWAVVSPWRMHCMYSGMAKGTSQAEATSDSEKIKPIALAIVELRKSE